MNSIAGLISTLVNVYSAQSGQYSSTAKSTTIITGICATASALLFLLYNNWALSGVKAKHHREVQNGGRSVEVEGIHNHEGMVEKVKRKANKPAMEPGSVV